MDAIAMLKADHDKVKALLADLEATTERGVKTRAELFSKIKGELTVHEIIEEEIFYPELKAHPKAKDIVLEGYQEHHVVDLLMGELEQLDVADESWGAKAIVMKENVEHHIEEEEGEMFKQARGVFDEAELRDLGERMAARKVTAAAELGIPLPARTVASAAPVPAEHPTTLAAMTRRSALVLLVVFGIGVFLAGLELMITAVALPSILDDLADPAGGSAWIELRKASWIINGYLLVYILTMPLAGRLTDLWGARRPFMAALVDLHRRFGAGRPRPEPRPAHRRAARPGARRRRARPGRDGRGGPPVRGRAPAAGARLHRRPDVPRDGRRAVRRSRDPRVGPRRGCPRRRPASADRGPTWSRPAWRWVFFINVPIGLDRAVPRVGGIGRLGHAPARRPGRCRRARPGSASALLAGLVGLTLIGTTEIAGSAVEPVAVTVGLLAAAAVTHGGVGRPRPAGPRSVPRPAALRDPAFSAAALVSLLTGYAFATAIIGGAVFVDRVLYGGPDEQRLALGALAGATAVGALLSGLAVRFLSLRLVTLVGLALSIGGLAAMAAWTPESSIELVALTLGAFGLGFGLTVTPRSTAAVEAAGRRAFGAASSIVTVARMIGMAVGLAILTAYGSTTIDRLADQVYATPDAYLALVPESLRDRPLRDPLVVDALEEWASREAARIMVGPVHRGRRGQRARHPAVARPGRACRVCWQATRPPRMRPPPEAPIPMAAKRPKRGSRSERRRRPSLRSRSSSPGSP